MTTTVTATSINTANDINSTYTTSQAVITKKNKKFIRIDDSNKDNDDIWDGW